MNLSTANGVHVMEPQVKLKFVRNKATGKVTSQSTNKTKKLLKTGYYVEVTSGGEIVDADRLTVPQWAPGIGKTVNLDTERANAQKEGRPLLWLAAACFSIAIVGGTLVWALH